MKLRNEREANMLLHQSIGDDFPEPHMREVRGVHGGGIARVVIAVLLVAACAVVGRWLA